MAFLRKEPLSADDILQIISTRSFLPPRALLSPLVSALSSPRTPHMMPHGSPYFHQPLAPVRFPIAPVPGVLPHPMFRPVPPLPAKQSTPQIQLDFHPSKESIDAAIGDVLAKPWSPLPLGLKPPSTDSVLVELHRRDFLADSEDEGPTKLQRKLAHGRGR